MNTSPTTHLDTIKQQIININPSQCTAHIATQQIIIKYHNKYTNKYTDTVNDSDDLVRNITITYALKECTHPEVLENLYIFYMQQTKIYTKSLQDALYDAYKYYYLRYIYSPYKLLAFNMAKIIPYNEGTCAICYSEYEPTDEIIELACNTVDPNSHNHNFHQTCLCEWIITQKTTKSCPICRCKLN